jgi:hypothetical protein
MADYSDIIEQAGRQFNVDPKLLALVVKRESGGNPGAVSPKGAVGLAQIMPDTAREMGVTNPKDPAQNIMAGAKYLAQQLDKYKDVPLALAAYNAGPGAVDKHRGIPPYPETRGYVQSIMTAYQGGATPAAGAGPNQQALPGMPPVPGASTAAPANQSGGAQSGQLPGLPPMVGGLPQAASADPFSALMAKAGAAPAPGRQQAQAATSTQADPFSQLVTKANQAAAQPERREPGILDLPGAAIEPIATMATGAVGGLVGGATRLGAAALGKSYEEAKGLGDKVQNALTYHPMTDGGKASMAGLGDLASKAKNAIMDSPVGSALSSAGKAYDDTFVKGSTNPLMATVNDMIPGAAANVAAGKLGGMALDAAKAAPNVVRAGVDRAAAAVGRGRATPAALREPTPTPVPLAGVGAASADLNPYPALSGEEAARGGSSVFPQVKTSKIAGDVPVNEQRVRAQIANEILGDDHGAVRPGVVTGNEDTLRTEYTHAKSAENTPAQILLRHQIAQEQTALSNYAQARIEATGANPHLINNEQRGQVINDAFHGEGGLTDYFKRAKDEIYDKAKAESGNNPIPTQHVDDLLNDPQFLAEAERNGHARVVSGIQKLIDHARHTGFKDPLSGEVHGPGSVGAWDAVRKSNNAAWTHENGRTITAINQAIDQDIASAAGSEAYKVGDAIHQTEKMIMNPRFMRSVFGSLDENGVKAGAPLEQLPTRLNNLPVDQWKHVYNTLDDLSRGQVRGAPEGMPAVPQELRQAATAARNEMAGALAREVYEQGAGKAGVWNQNDANKVLNSVVGQKIVQSFPPDEVAKFHTLNLGGQIMPGVHSYDGAKGQEIRLSKPTFVEKGASKAGATVGGAVGGTVGGVLSGGTGAAAGAQAGAAAGNWVGNKLAQRATSKRLSAESNKLLDAMKSNARMGK